MAHRGYYRNMQADQREVFLLNGHGSVQRGCGS